MKWILNATLITLSLTGCIIYDEDLSYEEDFNRPEDRTNPAEDEDRFDREQSITLSPNHGTSGELVLVSLVADGGASLKDVSAITFYGESDIEVVAEQDRGELELLIAVDIAADSLPGANHLLVEFHNGDEVFINDAFTVAD